MDHDVDMHNLAQQAFAFCDHVLKIEATTIIAPHPGERSRARAEVDSELRQAERKVTRLTEQLAAGNETLAALRTQLDIINAQLPQHVMHQHRVGGKSLPLLPPYLLCFIRSLL